MYETNRHCRFKKPPDPWRSWEKFASIGVVLTLLTIADEGSTRRARLPGGMTDRYAVTLFENLYIPKPWVGPLEGDSL